MIAFVKLVYRENARPQMVDIKWVIIGSLYGGPVHIVWGKLNKIIE